MRMVPLKVWIADILAAKGLIGVNVDVALDALRKTAIDFCTQTTIWEYICMFPSQANVSDYPIDVLPSTRVASVAWVSVNGSRIAPSTMGLPITLWPRGQNPNRITSGYGTFYVDDKEWIYIPTPQEDGQVIEVGVALKPAQDSCELPDFFQQDWNDALTAGTAYRLFQIPKQEWTNASLAMVNQREYNREKARARQFKMQNNTQATATMTGSYF